MTEESMPEVPAREREFPDGSRGMLMHVNFGPLPDDPAERTIEVARRSAVRAEMAANAKVLGMRTGGPHTGRIGFSGHVRYVWDLLRGRA